LWTLRRSSRQALVEHSSVGNSPADAGFVRWGTQIRHLARISTVDNDEIEELNSFR
jgi:hypothetical protein